MNKNRHAQCTEVDDCTVLYTNVDSFLNKRNELFARIDEIKPKIIALTEIFDKNQQEVNVAEYFIPGYDMFLNLTPRRGVAIYTKSQLNAKEITELNDSLFNESVWCSFLDGNDENVLFGCIYRSPNSSVENTNELYRLLKMEYFNRFSKICIVGDFNFLEIQWRGAWSGIRGNEFVFLNQMVDKPTRSRLGQTSNILDLILVNEVRFILEVIHSSPIGKSDHETLTFTLYTGVDRARDQDTTLRYDLNRGNYHQMRITLGQVKWTRLLDMDVDNCWNYIKSQIHGVMSKYIITTAKKKTINYTPRWMNKPIKRIIKNKYVL